MRCIASNLTSVIAAMVAGVLLTACGDPDAGGADGGVGDPDASGPGPGDPDASGPGPGDPDASPPDPTVTDLLALLQSCDTVGGTYSTDVGDPSTINVCGGLTGAVFWKADLDVDCDGIRTDVCNENTDGAYQPRTSATDSNGEFLDASQLPYVVIPLPSNRWDYASAGLDLGTVVAVIYDGKLEFGVFGDQGPDDIIGEASYAMAKKLGIDPDPNTGGSDGPVYYIAFSGDSGRVSVMEDHAEAVTIGTSRVQELLSSN